MTIIVQNTNVWHDRQQWNGLDSCPCLSQEAISAQTHSLADVWVPPAVNATGAAADGFLRAQYEGVNGTYLYPASYGSGCSAHDQGVPPFCAETGGGVPSFCAKHWCYVDKIQCFGGGVQESHLFGDLILMYSYETCLEGGGSRKGS